MVVCMPLVVFIGVVCNRSGNNQNLDLDEYVFVTGSVPDGLTVRC